MLNFRNGALIVKMVHRVKLASQDSKAHRENQDRSDLQLKMGCGVHQDHRVKLDHLAHLECLVSTYIAKLLLCKKYNFYYLSCMITTHLRIQGKARTPRSNNRDTTIERAARSNR